MLRCPVVKYVRYNLSLLYQVDGNQFLWCLKYEEKIGKVSLKKYITQDEACIQARIRHELNGYDSGTIQAQFS